MSLKSLKQLLIFPYLAITRIVKGHAASILGGAPLIEDQNGTQEIIIIFSEERVIISCSNT